MHYSTIIKMLKRAVKLAAKMKVKNLPFIMLAHSKSIYSYKNLDKLLRIVSEDQQIKFSTTQEVVNNLREFGINNVLFSTDGFKTSDQSQ